MKRSVVLVILLILCVVFCACGKDTTANKTPSVSQTPEQQNTLPTFTKESTESIHDGLGNSIANYSSWNCLLAECKDYIFHSYNEDHQIMLVEKSTGSITPLSIYGTNLSIYDHILYFVSPDKTELFAYNLVSGAVYSPTLPPLPASDCLYYQLFVSPFGFFVAYTNIYYSPVLVRNISFDGDIIAEKQMPASFFIVISNSAVAARVDDKMCTYTIPDLIEASYIFPESISTPASFGNGRIYSHMYNKPIITMLDLESSELTQVEIDNGNILDLRVHNENIYYTTIDGTFVISSLSQPSHKKLSNMRLINYSFTTDGYIYSFHSTSDSPGNISTIHGFYIRLKADGSDMTVLSN